MIARGAGRVVFWVAVVVLLGDGVAAAWLGQLTGHRALLVVGVVLLGAALAVALVYNRWLAALAEVDAARKDLARELRDLRRALDEARASGGHA